LPPIKISDFTDWKRFERLTKHGNSGDKLLKDINIRL
jgi:hypothetical protein